MKKLFALCILSLFMVACSGLEIINDPPLRVTTGSNVNAFTKSTSINKYEYCATETGIDDGGWTVLKNVEPCVIIKPGEDGWGKELLWP